CIKCDSGVKVMKYLILVSVLCMMYCLPVLAAETKTGGDWGIGVELVPGVGHIREKGNMSWTPRVHLNYALIFSYDIVGTWSLHSGIGEQKVFSSEDFIHPYPYVFDMGVRVETQAVRIPLTITKELPLPNHTPGNLQIGFGVYTDWIVRAKAYKTLRYLNNQTRETLDIKDELAMPITGIQFLMGLKHDNMTLDFRYWQDVSDFAIPTVDSGKLRRSYYGIGVSIDLYNTRNTGILRP
ncbi:MAG: hypothetical protein U1C33_05420, partial [Candidatus Cloacimonadaceae bacterium]|nr:hypothetical protein [Candidatus Cloacimonadaceae bacterium]